MLNRRLIHRVLLLGVVLSNVTALAANETNIQPMLHMVPMRDGTKLATDVYLPADGQPPYPVILMRPPHRHEHASRIRQTALTHSAPDLSGRDASRKLRTKQEVPESASRQCGLPEV